LTQAFGAALLVFAAWLQQVGILVAFVGPAGYGQLVLNGVAVGDGEGCG
jgi:hypothetical protein